MAIALPPRPTKKITSQRITPIFTTPSDASVPWSPRPGRPQGYELPPQISGCSSWKNSYVGKKRKVRTPPGTPRGVGPPPTRDTSVICGSHPNISVYRVKKQIYCVGEAQTIGRPPGLITILYYTFVGLAIASNSESRSHPGKHNNQCTALGFANVRLIIYQATEVTSSTAHWRALLGHVGQPRMISSTFQTQRVTWLRPLDLIWCDGGIDAGCTDTVRLVNH